MDPSDTRVLSESGGRDPADLNARDPADEAASDAELEAAVDALVGEAVEDALAPPPPLDLKTLHDLAVQAAHAAVVAAEDEHAREVDDMGRRLRAEQDDLHASLMADLQAAVRQAAAAGQRVATVLRFGGSDRMREFCYLYMLKGPVKAEHRAEMRAMGAAPLLPRLRRELGAAGFGVHHAWQRATNENALSVSW